EALEWLAVLRAGDDVRADTRNGSEYLNGGVAEVDRSRLVVLAIRQADEAPFPIKLVPLDSGDLAGMNAGDQRTAKPGCREGADLALSCREVLDAVRGTAAAGHHAASDWADGTSFIGSSGVTTSSASSASHETRFTSHFGLEELTQDLKDQASLDL